MFKPFVEFFTGEAFRPDPQDVCVPLGERFKNRRLLMVSGIMGQSTMSTAVKYALATFDSSGVPTISDVEYVSDLKNIDTQKESLKSKAEMLDVKEVAWLIPTFVVSVSSKVIAMSDEETLKMARDNPARLIGAQKEEGKAYSVVRHPKLSTSLIFVYTIKHLREIMEVVGQTDLSLVRLQSGIPSMLQYLLDKQPDKALSNDIFMVDHSTTFHLQVDRGDWPRSPMSRAEALGMDPPGVLKAVVLRQTAQRLSQPLVVVDTTRLGVAKIIEAAVPTLKVESYGVPAEGQNGSFEFEALCHN